MLRCVARRGVVLPALALVLALVGSVAFLSQRTKDTLLDEFAVASEREVTAEPLLVTVQMRNGEERRAQRAPYPLMQQGMGWPPDARVVPVPVFLVRAPEGDVRAFVGVDPRNGCLLDLREWQGDSFYHDRCHGSLYDPWAGAVRAGPSPFDLNRLEVAVRDGAVYVYPRRIIPGRLHTEMFVTPPVPRGGWPRP